jgi:hypothetical protein
MGHKAVETTRNMSQAFGQRTVNEDTAHHWFKAFELRVGSATSSCDWRQSVEGYTEADLPKTTREVAEELNVGHAVSRWLPTEAARVQTWV